MIDLSNLHIPTDVVANIKFRAELHDWLARDVEAQKAYIALCKEFPHIWFDTCAWTYDPRAAIGERNKPFILRPQQVKALYNIKRGIDTGTDIGMNKSRDEGATELLMKYITFLVMFVPDTTFLIGSRTEELVDKTGDTGTLFAKIDYTVSHLPNWLSKRLHLERTFKHFRNLDINSTIDGEATSENFGAGKRATAVVLDEFGRVEPKVAKAISDTVKDISGCIIVNSTHWYGTSHAFNTFIKRKDIILATLMWYDNPVKSKDLYFDYNSKDWPLPIRSPWFDNEAKRRSRRDVMMNIWGDPSGAAEQFFDGVVNETIRAKFVRKPAYEGSIKFDVEVKNSTVPEATIPTIRKITNEKFVSGGKVVLRWWGELKNYNGKLRPNQLHNYIIGSDISFGTGASNSTAEIVDRNTGELVGEYVTPDMPPDEFADAVTALSHWIGGVNNPFVIWERTGGHGINFGRRLMSNGILNVYTKTSEDKKTRKRLNVYGWDNTGGANSTKLDLLERLQIALKEGLKDNPDSIFIKIFSEELVNELDTYIFYASGELASSTDIDESTGARLRHGDRVIGLGLCVLGLLDQPTAVGALSKAPPWGSYAWRQEQRRRIEATKRETWGEPKNSLRGF